MKKFVFTFLALCLMILMCTAAWVESAAFAGGSGTEEYPFQIASVEQLLALSAAVNDSSAQGYPEQYFILTADINLTDTEWQSIGHMDLENMENYSCMFFDTFDGQDHTLSNVTFTLDYPVLSAALVYSA